MSNKRIVDLPVAGSGQGADLVFLHQGGVLKSCTLSALLENLAQMFPCASLSAASLPSPSDNRGRIVHCTDGDNGSPALAVSDGSIWRLLSVGNPIFPTPGMVNLGTPGPDGIPYTMPAPPGWVGTLILQKADDDGGGNPNDGTWTDIVADLSGGASGTDGTGSGGGSAAGAQNTRFHYRAKNTNGGAVGPATSEVTVDLPAAPDAPSLTPGGNSGDIDITTPGLPDRASSFSVLRADLSGSASGFGDVTANPSPSSTYTQSPGADVYCEAYVVAQNAYGSTDGSVGNGTAAS